MRRDIKATVFFLLAPFGGFALALVWAVTYGMMGWQFDAEMTFQRCVSWVGGTVFGWWIWGAK